MRAEQTSPSATVTPPLFKREQVHSRQREKGSDARPIAAFNAATQTMAESLATAQERNLKYAQSVFESTIVLRKDYVESTHSLLEQWEQQAQKQPVVPGDC